MAILYYFVTSVFNFTRRIGNHKMKKSKIEKVLVGKII